LALLPQFLELETVTRDREVLGAHPLAVGEESEPRVTLRQKQVPAEVVRVLEQQQPRAASASAYFRWNPTSS
jgi:hypothetical protein